MTIKDAFAPESGDFALAPHPRRRRRRAHLGALAASLLIGASVNAEIRYVLPTGAVDGLDMISFGWAVQYRF